MDKSELNASLKPSIQEQIDYVKDIRESLNGGFEINILALPREQQMWMAIHENLIAVRNLEASRDARS